MKTRLELVEDSFHTFTTFRQYQPQSGGRNDQNIAGLKTIHENGRRRYRANEDSV
jgi:hypothetical protein